MATRNLALEQKAIGQFGKIQGRLPKTPNEWALVHQYAYGADIPEELKAQIEAGKQAKEVSMASAGTEGSTPLPTPQAGQPYGGEEFARAKVGQTGEEFQKYSQPTVALDVLQEAIRKKTQANQMELGVSDVFQKAGVSGMGALAASLSARNRELEFTATDFKNSINTMAGTYRDMAQSRYSEWQAAREDYKNLLTQVQKREEDLIDFQQQIEIVQLQSNLDTEKTKTIERYKYDIETGMMSQSPQDIANAIKQVESGGNYSAQGVSGEIGAYQFLPATWSIVANQYAKANGLELSPDMTPENQDAVAVWKIAQLQKQGYSPQEIALIWNTSLGGAEKPLIRKGEGYDSQQYSDSVVGVLRKNSTIPMDEDTIKNETLLRKEFNDLPITKTNNILENYLARINVAYAHAIEQAKTGKSKSAADQALIVSFNKMLDETSVVKEGEYDRTEQGQAVLNRLSGYSAKLQQGGTTLTDTERLDIKNVSEEILTAFKKKYNGKIEEYRILAKDYGVSPDRVVKMPYTQVNSLSDISIGQFFYKGVKKFVKISETQAIEVQ